MSRSWLITPLVLLTACPSSGDLQSQIDTLAVDADSDRAVLQAEIDALRSDLDAAVAGLGTAALTQRLDAVEGELLGTDADFDASRIDALEDNAASTTELDLVAGDLADVEIDLAAVTAEVTGTTTDLADSRIDRLDLMNAGTRLTLLEDEIGIVAGSADDTRIDQHIQASAAFATTQAVADGDAAVLATVGNNNYATEQWAIGQFTTEDWVTGKGYATEAWVTGKGYATESFVANSDFATESWVGDQGYALQSGVTDDLADLELFHTTHRAALESLSVTDGTLYIEVPVVAEDVAQFDRPVGFASTVTSVRGIHTGAAPSNPGNDPATIQLFQTNSSASTWMVNVGKRRFGGVQGGTWFVYFSENFGCDVEVVRASGTLACDGTSRTVSWTRPGADAYTDVTWLYLGQ